MCERSSSVCSDLIHVPISLIRIRPLPVNLQTILLEFQHRSSPHLSGNRHAGTNFTCCTVSEEAVHRLLLGILIRDHSLRYSHLPPSPYPPYGGLFLRAGTFIIRLWSGFIAPCTIVVSRCSLCFPTLLLSAFKHTCKARRRRCFPRQQQHPPY